MALPKINSPIFELTLPSTGKEIKYRPFLVKEQKLLLMALESKEQKEMLRAIKQIINNCSVDKIDVDELPMFDLEYFFIRLRAKSVGEEIELRVMHPNGKNKDGEACEHVTNITVDLTAIEVEKEEGHDRKIVLDEGSKIGICLKYPTMAIADKVQLADQQTQIDVILNLVADSVDYIFDSENVYPAKESSRKEILEFINNLSQEQFEKLTNFFNTMPKLKHTLKWKCIACGCQESVTLEGMASFFG